MSFYIIKSSGVKELFSIKKFRRSLKKAGASESIISQIINELQQLHPQTTKEIHEYTIKRLRQENPPIAARYNLKRALMELGPAGYSFELFITELLRAQGYTAQTHQIVKGICVTHEVDIVAEKENKKFMIECKFHNQPGLKSDIKVMLYTQARFEDIHRVWDKESERTNPFHQPWLITNTQCTSEAVAYAQCMNMKLTSWGYPEGEGLAETIDALGLHPITALTTLSRRNKREFIEHGFVLCKDASRNVELLKKLGFTQREIDNLIAETSTICKLQ